VAIISLRSERSFILSRSARYCVSTPTGLRRFIFFSTGFTWGDEKEVPLVLKLDPIFILLQFYDFKNLKLTIISLRSLLRFFNLLIINH
jgi:hypothetical protein